MIETYAIMETIQAIYVNEKLETAPIELFFGGMREATREKNIFAQNYFYYGKVALKDSRDFFKEILETKEKDIYSVKGIKEKQWLAVREGAIYSIYHKKISELKDAPVKLLKGEQVIFE